jgi:hypothetical protein
MRHTTVSHILAIQRVNREYPEAESDPLLIFEMISAKALNGPKETTRRTKANIPSLISLLSYFFTLSFRLVR